MDKRYQVFISSTYNDLKEEREKVMYAVMRLNHIPAGMELFPAVDEEQFTYIKRVIDISDYYILIVGGRYGSLTDEGLSYTEKEYDYAVEKKKKVIALLHKSPDKIPVGKSDIAPELRDKLSAFRKKVETSGKVVSYWETPDELSALAMAALINTITLFPTVGWIRGNTITNPEAFQELNEVRKDLQRLKEENEKYVSIIQQENLINRFKWVKENLCLDVQYHLHSSTNDCLYEGTYEILISWDELLLDFLPYVSSPSEEWLVKFYLGSILSKLIPLSDEDRLVGNTISENHLELQQDSFNEIKIRLMGDEIIYTDVKLGGTIQEQDIINNRMHRVEIADKLIWSLSEVGAKLYSQLKDEKIEA